MEAHTIDKHILEWDEDDVHAWFAHLGYPQYQSQIRGKHSSLSTIDTDS
jgi:hypothetical protein